MDTNLYTKCFTATHEAQSISRQIRDLKKLTRTKGKNNRNPEEGAKIVLAIRERIRELHLESERSRTHRRYLNLAMGFMHNRTYQECESQRPRAKSVNIANLVEALRYGLDTKHQDYADNIAEMWLSNNGAKPKDILKLMGSTLIRFNKLREDIAKLTAQILTKETETKWATMDLRSAEAVVEQRRKKLFDASTSVVALRVERSNLEETLKKEMTAAAEKVQTKLEARLA